MNDNQNSYAPAQTVLEVPRTAGDVARELGPSVTTIKQLAVAIHAPVQKTPGGVWIFSAAAVEKLKLEIQRRRIEALR